MRILALIGMCGCIAGCFAQGRGVRDRGAAGIFESTDEIRAPLQNRCEVRGTAPGRKRCDEALYLAQRYVRALSKTDDLCLEGGFGEPPGGECLARAKVADVANDRVLVGVVDAQPSSRWYPHVSSEIWFEEGALIDLYLAERGY